MKLPSFDLQFAAHLTLEGLIKTAAIWRRYVEMYFLK